MAYGPTGRDQVWNWGTGQSASATVYANGSPLATFKDGGIHFRHGDWVGTERVQTFANGVKEASFESLTYGDGYGTNSAGSDTDGAQYALLDCHYGTYGN